MNIEATKKRRARNAKRMRGVEYQSARAGAMERAGGRCEYVNSVVMVHASPNVRRTDLNNLRRCEETDRLQFHEEHYPKTRPLTSDDGKIYCRFHHRLVEKQKLHKANRSGF